MDSSVLASNWFNSNGDLFDATPTTPIAPWNDTTIQMASVMAQTGTPQQKEDARIFFGHHLNVFRDTSLERSVVPVAPWNPSNRAFAIDLLHSSNREEILRGCMYFEYHMDLIRKGLNYNAERIKS